MATIYYDNDADLASLKNKVVAIIGYGNQGCAHALNLRDSGIEVIVGARLNGKAFTKASADGFATMSVQEATSKASVLAIMLPDEAVASVFENEIAPGIAASENPHKAFVFAHGFTVTNKTIPLPEDADIILVAPTGPGRQVRSLYLEGKGLPALIAVEQDKSGQAFNLALAYAKAIGSTRAGAIQTTFLEETTTDLFCEQAVLCGGMPELIKASFNTLVAKGYQPELAYISCLKEVKLIADLLFTHGMDGMRDAISNTAKYGSVIAGPAIIDAGAEERLATLLTNIEGGQFAQSFLAEAKAGSPVTRAYASKEAASKLASTGRELKDKLHF
ncbi:MAG: ketol-acid reductoisomerase [Candidatus Obscuribacterales bacterium]|jgi:ketol-acid reductoisomerase